MTCNVCGGVIPEGATVCPVCGTPVAPPMGQFQDTMNTAQGANPFGMGGANPNPNPNPNPYGTMDGQGFDPSQPMGMNDPYAVPSMNTQLQTPTRKSHTGLIIGIIAAVAVVAALVVCLILGVFSGKNGKYYLDSMTYMGTSLSADSLKAFGLDVSTLYIEIDGDKFTISLGDLGEGSATGDCSIDGDKITLTYEGRSIEGTISGGKITIDIEGSGMVFKK